MWSVKPAMYRSSGQADMSQALFEIRPERPDDRPAIERLLDEAFGAARRQKTAYRLREHGRPVPGLSFVAWADDALVGTIQLWPLAIGEFDKAVLLGPLAVARHFKGKRCGITLMELGLDEARRKGWRLAVLVGDEPYYSQAGFRRAPAGRLIMPGPVDPDRLLICELAPDAFDDVSGEVRPGRL
jgi:predicted N-acetyltransferase YhbS